MFNIKCPICQGDGFIEAERYQPISGSQCPMCCGDGTISILGILIGVAVVVMIIMATALAYITFN